MADMPFADASDVEVRWRPLSPTEMDTAEQLAADASDMIRDRWPDVDERIAAGTLRESSVVRVVAGMVKRAMLNPGSEGVASQSQATGPFSVTNQYANPMANLYLNAEDVRLFDGRTGRRAFAVDLATAPPEGDWRGYC